MSYNLGLNIVEVDGRAAPSIQAAPTSVAAFVICAPKGVPGRVEPVSNRTRFVTAFGGYMEGAYGAYAVRGFFDNGGTLAYVTRVVPESAIAASQTFKTAGDNGADALTVTAGFRGTANPGTGGNAIAIQIVTNTDDTYTLLVRQNETVVETWAHLNNSAAPNAPGQNPELVINDELTGSQYITVKQSTANPAATLEGNQPIFVSLAGGANGAFANPQSLGSAAAAALAFFDTHQVQLVCCPESDHQNWVSMALAYCAQRGDCLFVGHTPRDNEASAAGTYGQGFQGAKVYGALYFPWIRVADPTGKPIWIPPTGHVLGVYARTERERGIWKAPAGNAARLNGVQDVRYAITDTQHTDMVKNGSVNAVRFIPGQGIIIDSSRTLSTDTRWLYVNVRLLFNFVKSSLMSGLRWVVQEPNDATLWNKVKYNSVMPFLMGLWRRGAFGTGAPEDVFEVKIDGENNPPDKVQQGMLTVEVYFYPSRPAETIVLIVGQHEGAATTAEG